MRRPDQHNEIVAVFAPVLAEAVVVAFAVGVACLWVVILSGRLPA
ncbi:MAG TPA: hypothetical protein VF499_04250 [Afipia sp.]